MASHYVADALRASPLRHRLQFHLLTRRSATHPRASLNVCNFGPLPVVEMGGMKVPGMSKVPDLQIEVQEALRRIVVKTPGTAYELSLIHI